MSAAVHAEPAAETPAADADAGQVAERALAAIERLRAELLAVADLAGGAQPGGAGFAGYLLDVLDLEVRRTAVPLDECRVCRPYLDEPGSAWAAISRALPLGHDATAHRVYGRLSEAGITTRAQAERMTDTALLDLRSLGYGALERIRAHVPRPDASAASAFRGPDPLVAKIRADRDQAAAHCGFIPPALQDTDVLLLEIDRLTRAMEAVEHARA